jgi:hypothetical protein
VISAVSLFTVVSVIIFLSGSAFGALVLFAISIHRTKHRPLSGIHGERAGTVSRSVLTTTRAGCKGKGE